MFKVLTFIDKPIMHMVDLFSISLWMFFPNMNLNLEQSPGAYNPDYSPIPKGFLWKKFGCEQDERKMTAERYLRTLSMLFIFQRSARSNFAEFGRSSDLGDTLFIINYIITTI
jgi:hypothetical protein